MTKNNTLVFLLLPKEAYKLPDLSPASWAQLLVDMEVKENGLFRRFYKMFSKSVVLDRCREVCKRNMLCMMKDSVNGHNFCNMHEHQMELLEMWKRDTYNKC